MGYLRPVPFTRSTSWATHRRRNPPSTEPGVDYFCPIGTPVAAAESGRVVDTGDSIGPATGRFVTIDLDDGRRVRYLHLSRRAVGRGERVSRGQVVGYSGATGYGTEDWSWNVAETGGAHVHMTVWATQRYAFGSNATLDPEPLMSETPGFAGTGAKPFTPAPVEPPKRKKRTMIYAAWRDKNDTIAVQAVAGGKVTLLKDPTEWAGIQAATGAEYAQVENAQLQAILERFGKLESPAFDTTTGAAAQVVVPLDGQNDRYQWAGDRLEWIDGEQLTKLQEQGARTQFLARNQIEKLTS